MTDPITDAEIAELQRLAPVSPVTFWWDSAGHKYAKALVNAAPRLLADLVRLRQRLHEQTQQTQITYSQIHEAVIAKLTAKGITPHCDWQGHPVEQVIGTELSALLGEIERVREDVAVVKALLGESQNLNHTLREEVRWLKAMETRR